MKLRNILVLPIIHLLVGEAFGIQSPPPASEPKVDNRQQAETDLKSIATALMSYKMNAGVAPTTAQGLKALVEKPDIDPIPRRWVRLAVKLPTDPWKSPYRYRFPGAKDPKKFEVISDGPDRVPGTEDDLIYQEQ